MDDKKEFIRSRYNATADHYDARYHLIQSQKYAAFTSFLTSIEPLVLDIGGGSGLLLRQISNWVVVVDLSQKMLRFALNLSNCTAAVASDGEQLPFRNNSSQMITSFSVVQNYENRAGGLDELVRITNSVVLLTILTKTMPSEEIEDLLSSMPISWEYRDLPLEDSGYVLVKSKPEEVLK